TTTLISAAADVSPVLIEHNLHNRSRLNHKTAGRRNPSAQVKGDEAVVLPGTPEPRTQMAPQSGVVAEPPEGGPRKNDPPNPGPAEPLQLSDGGRVIRRRAPVLAVLFQEGYPAASAHLVVGSQVVI